jgi:peptidoglycan hydrolase FlgJ
MHHLGSDPSIQTLSATPASVGGLSRAKKPEDSHLKKAAQDFEALFMTQMLQEMRKTIPDGGLFAKSGENRMYESMMDEQLGYQLAQGRGMGLSQSLYRQLLRSSDQAPAALAPHSQEA